MITPFETTATSSPDTAGTVAQETLLQSTGARTGVDARVAWDANRALHAGILLLAPSVMAAGLFYHPTIGNPLDADFLTRLSAAVTADTFRWAVAHHLTALGSGLIALAFLALDARLRQSGQSRAAAVGFPLIVAGSLLYALLPAMEFAPLAAAESGADPGAAQRAIFPWFIPTLYSGALLFLAGSIAFARGILRIRAVARWPVRVAALGLIVAALCRLVPINVIHMDVQAVAGILALWPLAYVTWNEGWRRIA